SDRLIATNGVLVTLVTDSSNGLSGRLVSTNAALVSLVTTSSNGLQAGIDAEGTARAALVTKLETGNNSFAGSNHFSGIATLTNMNNVLAGNGSALTALNGTQVTSGTIDDARIDNALARDSELLSVSNALSGQIGSQSSALTGTITTTSNGLSDRLIATNGTLVTLVTDSSNGLSGRLVSTNAALVSLVTTSSNGLQSGIDAEGTARAALVTKLETGNNSFAGSNHFSGIVTLTNATNTLAGDGSALTGLNADQLTSGTISAARLPSGVVIDDGESGVSLQGGLSAASISGSGSGLTSLNASQLTSGTVPDARLDSVITRDTELSSVSSGLSANLVATNAALVSLVTTSSNGLRSSIEAESTARAALVTKLETGNNTFAGSNHFSGIVTLTNSDNVIAGVWRTGGNSGTSPGSDFIGTSDNQALEFQVNGARALKIAPESDSAPSITGGSSANSIATGVRGAVIAGGGEVFDGDGTFFRPNTILAGNFSAIGGGQQNTNSGAYAVIGGGGQNSVEANSFAATIGGGGENLVAGSGNYAAIGGGRGNAVTNRYASVPGGLDNRAGGQYSFAAGRRAKADADGAFVWADSQNADFISTVADSFNLRARGGVNVQAGTGSIALTGGLLTYNGNEVLTNGAAAALTSSNNFSANNTFAATNVFGGSNHFGGVLVATNAANVFVGSGAALSGLWKTSGNGGTSPGTDFVGTTDNEALVFKANNLQVMRLTPAVDEGAPNILMGAQINSIGSGVFGATISGGGAADFMNEGSASNIVNANYSTIGGGVGNLIDVNGYAGTIGGGVDNTVNTNADRSVISGGTGNEIARDTYAGSVGGGSGNSLGTDTDYSTIAGGSGNNASSQYVAIGGGQNNTVSGLNGFVGGGVGNNLTGSADYSGVASGNNNDITGGKYSFVGGGQNNTIISGADKSAIGSGIGNTVKASGSFLGSGFNNLIGNGGVSWAFIGAGAHNAIPNGNADSGVIGGGQYNTNSGSFTVIGGGYSNYVSDFYGTVPGGLSNSVSGYCGFAAGRHAASVHSGSFVWADATTTSNYSSTIANEFRVKATGGINFETTDRAKITINGVRLMNVNDDGFAQSDYRVKKNFQPIDTLEVVDKLAAMPVERWNYKKEGDHEVPHIGPYAQDFKQAFYPGRDDTKISWLEFHGVELAAIQGLNKKLESKEQEINLLRDELAQLRAMVMEMRKNEGQ
ncbi:MAG: tail fiber domain-containing protein, partial [Verrucomicrobiae bacterium]|nr:tail fiber domain-containing protein [Verrucomicrobiae bacterium]